MSRRSSTRQHHVDLETLEAFAAPEALTTPRRGLAMGASVLAASAVITGAGFVVPPVAGASAPVAVVQDVQLTTIPSYITDLQNLLTSLGLGTTQLGDVMTLLGVNPATTLDSLLTTMLGPFGDATIGSYLTWIPDMSIAATLGMVGLQGTDTVDDVVAELNSLTSLLGVDLDTLTINEVAGWFGVTTLDADTLAALTALGLTGGSDLSDILDSALVGTALGLPGNLGDASINGLLGISDDSISLTDYLLGTAGLQGTDTITEALETMLGADDTTTLLGALGTMIGDPGLDGGTTLNDLLGDIGTWLGTL